MDRDRWQQVESVFHGALERPAPARSAYLDEACAGDDALRKAVMDMLAAQETEPEFLEPLVKIDRVLPLDSDGSASSEVKRVGPYRIVRELGAGGMGVVYLAMHEGPDFERPVALKVIRRGLDTEELLKRFQLERRILAALKHPNVAHLTDAGQTPDGRPYFVMDFIEGVTIDVYAERNALSVSQRLQLFQQVCDAVQHAHNNLVVHRDLKPGNILVNKDGVPILLDFGIGKLLDPNDADTAPMTRTGARPFTPEYASPEQIRGEPVSTATDVYGLGLLLYQLLTGKRPFEKLGGYAFEKAVMETEPDWPSSLGGRALAGDLDTIVLKALRKEPERRYSSVAALSDDVQRYLDGLPVRARADTFRYRAGKFVRRHRLPVAAGVVTFVAMVSATVYSVAQAARVTRERDKALEVQTFLMEMFGAGGADRADTVSVRQLLDAQAAIVPIAYADKPELKAQMLSVLAEGYDRLGLITKAEPLAEEALKIRRGLLGPRDADLASSVSLLGWIAHERGKAKDAEVLLREALALWPGVRPPDPSGEGRTLNDFGVALEAAGKYDSAGVYLRRSMAMRHLAGDNDRAMATTGNNLAAVLYRKGDIKGAVAEADAALSVMRKVAGPDHFRSTVIQGNLAAMKAAMGDYKGAETEYRDLLARQSRVFGRKSVVTAQSMTSLASVLRSQQRYAEAEPLLVEALATYESAYGKEHARVAFTLSSLGVVKGSLKQFKQARPLLERALAINTKLRGKMHRDVAQSMSALGTLSGDEGNWAAAEKMHRQALDVWEKALGKTHVEVALARARLARAVYARRRPEEAASLYKEALGAMLATGMPATSASLRDTRLRYAQSLIALRRRSAADSVLAVVPDSGLTATQKALRDSMRPRK